MMKFKTIFLRLMIMAALLLIPDLCRAMPPGTLLYRTSGGGKMFGYSQDPLIDIEKGIVKNVYAGHVAIYIGKENGEDYVVEAMGGGVVKNPAKYFVNQADGEVFLGARMPRAVNALQQARVVALAKSLVGRNFGYDFDFHSQKGPGDKDWTCVGLAEKLYESANIANPNNIGALEYDPAYYAVDITPDGYDNQSVVNSAGDCMSKSREFSKIARRTNMIIPAPEIIGYDLGLEHAGDRYIFLPYTQFLQPTLDQITPDIQIASSFSREEVNGPLNLKAVAARWSLINNPISSVKAIFSIVKDTAIKSLDKIKEIAASIGGRLSGSDSGSALTILDDGIQKSASSSAQKIAAQPAVKVNKAAQEDKAAATKKTTSQTKAKTVAAKSIGAESGNTKSASLKVSVNKNTALEVSAEKTTGVKAEATKAGAKTALKATTTVKMAASAKATVKGKTATVAATTTKTSTPSYYIPTGSSGGSSVSTYVSSAANTAPVVPEYLKLAQINGIYGTANNHWVEIINPTDHDFDLAAAGYRLEKAKTAEDPSLLIRIGDEGDGTYPGGTVIKAHDSYLITSDQADSYYRQKADALVTRSGFSWTSSGYTIYLGTGAISSSTDTDIVDAVGFGADATYYLGSGPAPEITENHILHRASSSNDNAHDFKLILSDDQAIVLGDNKSEATSTPETATSSPETATSSPEIATSTPETATSSPEIATSTPDGTWGRLLLIQKIYSTGDNNWIELYNPTDHDFDLRASDYRLEKAVSADPSILMRFGNETDGYYPNGTVIKAHGSYMVVRDDADSYYLDQADAVATRTDFSWGGNGYSLYLGSGPISSSTDHDIVDLVGFGPAAKYYQGSGAALEITDAYVLNRTSNTHNNSTDFNLIASDDPNAAATGGDDLPDLYVQPTPTFSSGLTNVWHFNECYGPGSWSVGRWDCAKLVGVNHPPILMTLMPPANMNNGFSMSYYYRKTYGNVRINTTLSNANLKYAITVGDNYLQVEGLPESKFRYFNNIPSDLLWHRVDLVVNQAQDFWEIYIDAVLVAREPFMALLPTMSDLEVKSDGDPVAFDELALWNRSLSGAEILRDYEAEAPYSPLAARPDQKAAELVNFWNFNEGTGLTAYDDIGRSQLHLAPDAWTARAHNNYAIKTVAAGRVHSGLLPNFPATKDLSMGFWWRDRSDPYNGQADIYLTGGMDNEKKLFAVLADNYRLDYWFNNTYGILAEGLNKAIPGGHDWHYLNFVYDSYRYQLSFYVDGIEKASTSLIWMPDSERITGIKIVTTGEEAEIDDLSLWKGALSPRQVKEIYTNNK